MKTTFLLALFAVVVANSCAEAEPELASVLSDVFSSDLLVTDLFEEVVDAVPDVEVAGCETFADCAHLAPPGSCLVAACDSVLKACIVGPGKDYEPCDDNTACTEDDACLDGVCTGFLIVCGDGNPCTDNRCDPEEGCIFPAIDGPCDDGNTCTVDDVCIEGRCEGVIDPICDCSQDAECVKFDDGDRCNGDLACIDGQCQIAAGSVVSCDTSDDTTCFRTICEPSTGVCEARLYDDLACNDGNACTVGDLCAEGVCVPGEDKCPCDTDADCEPYDDTNLCNGSLRCDAGLCKIAAETLISCTDVPVSPCEKAVCQPETGTCEAEARPEGASCDDGDACTLGERCLEGVCGEASALNCDDEDACTIDTCDAQLGCVHESPAELCDDGEVCTEDTCDPLDGCIHLPAEGPCDDGDACTQDDICVDAVCVSGEALVCADDDPCTDDSCDSATGCAFLPGDGAACDDNNPCTTEDVCAAGLCVGGGDLDCDDGLVCTIDACDPALGCTHESDEGATCDDDNVCTTFDRCEASACVGSEPLDCDDGEFCTADDCDALAGCTHVDLALLCDDGDACTTVDVCSDGTCNPGSPLSCVDDDPCTDDGCDSATGCVFLPGDGASCDDSNLCTTNDSCVAGLCVGGAALNCDDGIVCTADDCDSIQGCVHVSDEGASCDDANVCTTVDRCESSTCVGGEPLECDDDEFCTQDDCDATLGCQHTDLALVCDDGNACTVIDVCEDGSCNPGAALTCVDDELCTDDACDPASGCIFPPNTLACDDDNACTTQDTCSEGECVGGDPPDCDDDNVCTDDICQAPGGCVHIPNLADCDDGEECTENDRCAATQCLGEHILGCGPPICGDTLCEPEKGELCDDCNADCGTCASEADCCQGHIYTPGCSSDESCEDLICNVMGESWCCDTIWHPICAEYAAVYCESCGADPCGDNICDAGGGEDCDTCPQDCGGPCFCGDGVCEGAENCLSCEADCDPCCGNGICDTGLTSSGFGDENCALCPADCGNALCPTDPLSGQPSTCCVANGGAGCNNTLCEELICEFDDNCCLSSPGWDSVCAGFASVHCSVCNGDPCGDGFCDPDAEACWSCSADCGACPVCGDGECNGSENCEWCEEDCQACPSCGDGVCNGDEDCESCPEDGCCPCGNGVCDQDESCLTCEEDCEPCPADHCCSPHGPYMNAFGQEAYHPGCGDTACMEAVCSQNGGAPCCEAGTGWDPWCAQMWASIECADICL